MPSRTEKLTETFKNKKKDYLAAIKDRAKALAKALKNRDDLEKYQSFIDAEEKARTKYYAAAEALQKSLTSTK